MSLTQLALNTTLNLEHPASPASIKSPSVHYRKRADIAPDEEIPPSEKAKLRLVGSTLRRSSISSPSPPVAAVPTTFVSAAGPGFSMPSQALISFTTASSKTTTTPQQTLTTHSRQGSLGASEVQSTRSVAFTAETGDTSTVAGHSMAVVEGAMSSTSSVKSPSQKIKTFFDFKRQWKGRTKTQPAPPSSFDRHRPPPSPASYTSSILFAGLSSDAPRRMEPYDPFGPKSRSMLTSSASSDSSDPGPKTPPAPSFRNINIHQPLEALDDIEDLDRTLSKRHKRSASKLAKTLGASPSSTAPASSSTFPLLLRRRTTQKRASNHFGLGSLPSSPTSATSPYQAPPERPRSRINSDPGSIDLLKRDSRRMSTVSCFMDSLGPESESAASPPSPMTFAPPGQDDLPQSRPRLAVPVLPSPNSSTWSFHTGFVESPIGIDEVGRDAEGVESSILTSQAEQPDFKSSTLSPPIPSSVIMKPSLLPPINTNVVRATRSTPSADHHIVVKGKQDDGSSWKGEWNQDTLGDVIAKLRALR